MIVERVILAESGGVFIARPYPAEYLAPYKFLYFKNQVGDELLIIGTRLTSRHSVLLEAFESMRGKLPRETCQGGGIIKAGEIEQWYSADFGSIPNELQPRVLELLEL